MPYKEGITADQAAFDLSDWRNDLDIRKSYLNFAAKGYTGINIIFGSVLAILSLLTMGGSASLYVNDGLIDTETLTVLLFIIGITGAVVTAIDKLVEPGSKAADCGIIGKHYSMIGREIGLEEEEAVNNSISAIPCHLLKSKLMNFSTRIQLVQENEPAMFFVDLIYRYYNSGVRGMLRDRVAERIETFKSKYEGMVPEVERMNIINEISNAPLTKYQLYKIQKTINKYTIGGLADEDFTEFHNPSSDNSSLPI